MARKVTAWGCEFGCGRRVTTKKSSMEAHEKNCFRNTARKACKTCASEEFKTVPAESLDGMITVKDVRVCVLGHLPEDKFIVFDCEFWRERKDEY